MGIKPEKVSNPIQLLAAWLLGLVSIDSGFLVAASKVDKPEWAVGALIIAAIVNVPMFLIASIIVQIKYRPEMLADEFYTSYVERRDLGVRSSDVLRAF